MTTPALPPFDPPYKTLTKTDKGIFATETLADGTTRDLGEVAPSNFNASENASAEPAPKRTKPQSGPAKTTTPGNSKAALYLNVPFADKDQAKAKGARWDATKKKWYAPHGADLNNFEPWWPDDMK